MILYTIIVLFLTYISICAGVKIKKINDDVNQFKFFYEATIREIFLSFYSILCFSYLAALFIYLPLIPITSIIDYYFLLLMIILKITSIIYFCILCMFVFIEDLIQIEIKGKYKYIKKDRRR